MWSLSVDSFTECNSAESLTSKYKNFGTESKQTVFQICQKTPFLTPSKKYIMIKEFKDKIKRLKKYISQDKKLELLREQEINGIKNETKRKLNMLDDEINNVSEKLDADLTTLITKCKFFEKPYDFECLEKER